MRLLYITYPDYIYTSGLVWHQVFQLLSHLARSKKDLKITVLSFVPFPEWIKRKGRHQVLLKTFPEINLITFPAFLKRNWILPLFPLFYSLTVLVTLFVCFTQKPALIHTRGVLAGLIACLSRRKIPWILDMRGLFPEEGIELKFWKQKSLSFRLWKKIEKHLLTCCSKVNFVSKEMAHQFPLFEKKSSLIPSGVDTQLFKPHSEPLCSDPLRLVYSGSTGWEDLENLKKIYQLFYSLNPKTELLFLLPHTLKTKEQDKICRFFEKESVQIDWCWPEEVSQQLQTAHIGVLTRHSSLVTRVMWPIKCLEYWACGIPVVTTPDVAAVNEWVEKKNLGIVLSLKSKEDDQVKVIDFLAQLPKMKKEIRTIAEENFNMAEVANQYLKLYETILSHTNN